MTTIQILEVLFILVGVVGSFSATLKYLIRFQRKIDRLLILSAVNKGRIEDVEKFLVETTNFKPEKQMSNSDLPELNTDFI